MLLEASSSSNSIEQIGEEISVNLRESSIMARAARHSIWKSGVTIVVTKPISQEYQPNRALKLTTSAPFTVQWFPSYTRKTN